GEGPSKRLAEQDAARAVLGREGIVEGGGPGGHEAGNGVGERPSEDRT
ncbi:ribonuclease III, partial [Methylobacterium sp. WL103]